VSGVGRKPVPVEVQIAHGDPRKIGKHKLRELQERQPQAPDGLPECPEHLSGLAAEAWANWTADLAAMGLSKHPDAIMLEGACVAYARAVEADEMVRKEGLIVGGLEDPKAHPAIGISEKSWRQVRSFCTEFGLTPSSRTRLALDKGADQGPSLADLLNDDGPEPVQ